MRMPCINRRLRNLCKRTDCRLWENPTLRLQLASVDGELARALQLAAQQALGWLAAKSAQTTDMSVSMLQGPTWMTDDGEDESAKVQALPGLTELLPSLCAALAAAGRLRRLRLRDYPENPVALRGSTIAALGALSQLADLQLQNVAMDTTVQQLGAALSPLTHLTRLIIEFGAVTHDFAGVCMECLPEAVCSLTALRVLRFGGLEFGFGRGISSALGNLQSLEHLGLRGWVQRDDAAMDGDGRPTLPDLPALRTAELQLRVQDGLLPLLPPPGGPPVTGLRTLALMVGSWADPPVLNMPALTELRMVGVGEHRPNDAMLWLAALPALQVLKLSKASFGSLGLPAGLVACTGLTELAINSAAVGAASLTDPARRRPLQPLRELPEGPYLKRLTRLSLVWNGFTEIPAALRCATALQELDMWNQHSEQEVLKQPGGGAGQNGSGLAHIGHLLTLCDLPNLRSVKLGPGTFPDLPDFQQQRPDVDVLCV